MGKPVYGCQILLAVLILDDLQKHAISFPKHLYTNSISMIKRLSDVLQSSTELKSSAVITAHASYKAIANTTMKVRETA